MTIKNLAILGFLVVFTLGSVAFATRATANPDPVHDMCWQTNSCQ